MGDGLDDRLRSLFKSGAVVFGGTMAQMGLSFVVATVVANLLSPAGYGAITLGTTVLGTASTLVLVGVHAGTERYLPRFDTAAARRGVLRLSATTLVPLVVVVAGGLFLGADLLATRVFGDPVLGAVFRTFALVLPFAVLVKYTTSVAKGYQDPSGRVVIENLLIPSARGLLVGAALVAAGASILGFTAAYAGAWVVAGVAAAAYLYRYTEFFDAVEARTPVDRRELLAFSLPLLASQVISRLLRDLDTFLLGAQAGTADVGVYGVAYYLAELLVVVTSSFGFLFTPVFSELDAAGDEAQMGSLYRSVTKWMVLLSVPVFGFVALYPSRLLGLLFGADYAGGGLALTALAVGFLFTATVGPGSEALTALGHTRTVLYDNVAAVALNGVLNVLLIPRFGILGAGVATAVSYTLLNLLLAVQLYDRTGIHPVSRGLVRASAGAAVVFAGAAVVAASTRGEPIPLLAGVYVGFVAATGLAVVALGGVGEAERMILDSVEHRFGVDLWRVRWLVDRLDRT
jgi:O-antigen/teichoic acid export membrane protein